MVVTGRTVASINTEITIRGFRITAADYVQSLETGRPPSRSGQESDFLKNLTEWVRRRGISLNPKSLKYLINKRGTRLWRGVDPRFPGKRNSGVITDVINSDTEAEISKEFEELIVTSYIGTIRPIFEEKLIYML